MSRLLSKVTVTSCCFYIKCSICPLCCWTSPRRHCTTAQSANAATVCCLPHSRSYKILKCKQIELTSNTDQMPMTSVTMSPCTGRKKCTSKQNVLKSRSWP